MKCCATKVQVKAGEAFPSSIQKGGQSIQGRWIFHSKRWIFHSGGKAKMGSRLKKKRLDFARRNAEFFLKHPAEILRVIEADLESDFADVHLLGQQQLFRPGEAEGTDELAGIFACQGSQLAVQLRLAHGERPAEIIHVEAGIREVLQDGAADFLEEGVFKVRDEE